MDVRQRFLEGLAAAAGFDPALLGTQGTVVRPRADREGTGTVVVYQAGEQCLIWCDPALEPALSRFASTTAAVTATSIEPLLAELGIALSESADMRVLLREPIPAMPIPSGFAQHWLASDNISHIDRVRSLTDRCSPNDVEEAGLGDLDNFDERAINVLSSSNAGPNNAVGDDGRLVAYASAADWDWDHSFGDIGVLVDPTHRQRGLGTVVVSHTVNALFANDRLPLYRHGHTNTGSRRIADALGFERATSLLYFARTE